MARLALTLLGSFQVRWGDQPVTTIATDKTRALLAYLVMERSRPHRRESLVALLWPDQPEDRARQSLRQAMLNLRQALEPAGEVLCFDRSDVQLKPELDVWVDAAEFTALESACRMHRHRQIMRCRPCLDRLHAMSELYGGEFLQGFSLPDSDAFEEWALLKREWLHMRAIETLDQLAGYHERRGETGLARQLAERQIQLEPWREEAHHQLIRLLALEGKRSAALAQYEVCRKILLRDFQAEPERSIQALAEHIRQADPDSELPLAERLHQAAPARLPRPFQALVGRSSERAELAERLAAPTCRLVTLTGPGGVGKSRLALAVANEQAGLHPHGIAWASLADVQDLEEAAAAISSALGYALYGKELPAAQLVQFLREKELLLALDNVEHLPALCDLVDAMLKAAPGVQLLVTSRARLGLQEETVYTVGGLPCAIDDTALLPQSEAVTLFIQAAQRTDQRFTLQPEMLPAVNRICRLVEGMPLAIELAAAWASEYTCAEIASHLQGGLDLLSSTLRNIPARQRSVRATFEHSWDLLPAGDRRLLAGLSVFRGGFELPAARAVTGASADRLAGLIEKSLLRRSPTGRYSVHELLRQFTAEKLQEQAGDAPETTAAAASFYYAKFIQENEPALKGAGQEAALEALQRELPNLRSAWDRAISALQAGDLGGVQVLRLAHEGLGLFYMLRCYYQEGASAFCRAAAALEPAAVEQPQLNELLGELLVRQARCMEFTAPVDEATRLYQRGLALFQQAGYEAACALPYYGLGYMAHIQGDYTAACAWFQRSLDLYRAAGNQWGAANTLSSLCLSLRRLGRYDEAMQRGQESLAIRRASGDGRGIASSLNNLGLIYNATGDYASADRALDESIRICRSIGHTVGIANALTSQVHVVHRTGYSARALELQREALEIFRQIGDTWGVAVAYNNLGQILMEGGDPASARTYFLEGAEYYRRAGIRTGLANILNNLGQACFELGETRQAARSLGESLQIAWETGDRPILLEVISRAAVLWASVNPTTRPAALLEFALAQPEMLEETRSAARRARERLPVATVPGLAPILTLESTIQEVSDALRDLE